jgi:hypothetical protein
MLNPTQREDSSVKQVPVPRPVILLVSAQMPRRVQALMHLLVGRLVPGRLLYPVPSPAQQSVYHWMCEVCSVDVLLALLLDRLLDRLPRQTISSSTPHHREVDVLLARLPHQLSGPPTACVEISLSTLELPSLSLVL